MSRRVLHAAGIGVGAAAISLILWTTGFFDLWEFAAWRWRVDIFSKPSSATPKIKLILLDQRSLDWGEKENAWSWQWPREVYTPIIDFCIRGGAKAVIFDMLFSEPSVYGVADDQALGEAINRTPLFITPLSLGRKTGRVKKWPAEIYEQFPLTIDNLDEWLGRLSPKSVKRLVMPRAKFPVPEISTSSALLAGVAQDPDFDGIFRRCHLFKLFDGHVVPSLSLAAFLAGESDRLPLARLPRANADVHPLQKMKIRGECIEIARRCIPIDASGKAILNFRGPAGTYQTFSAAEVIQSELRMRKGERPVIEDPAILKDCYIFFGTSAPGLLDLWPTPVSKVLPGVELHATMLDNLISGDFLFDPPKWASVFTTMLLALLGSALIAGGKKAWHSALTVGILLPLPAIIGFAVYPLGCWWPVILHESAIAIALTGGVLLNYAIEGRQKSFIKKAFQYYLSPQVIDKILKDPDRLKLGGERRELTILFSDLKGFSSISEQLDPQSLTGLLNEYLTDMTDIILEEGGTLDKYEGDAIIAFWNAPLDQPDHAQRACRAAIRCQRRLESRREDFFKKSGTLLHARIGINTGPVVVGNMGSKDRFNYTILGDAANLASRLEGANKAFGTFTMASEATWSQTEGEFLGREIGLLRVVGRKEPVRVYELLGFTGDIAPDWLEDFTAALALYYSRDLHGALGIFRHLTADPVAMAYANRCERLLEETDLSSYPVWNLENK